MISGLLGLKVDSTAYECMDAKDGCEGCVGAYDPVLCQALPDCWDEGGNNKIFKLKPVA